jgi:hypothetical protein
VGGGAGGGIDPGPQPLGQLGGDDGAHLALKVSRGG